MTYSFLLMLDLVCGTGIWAVTTLSLLSLSDTGQGGEGEEERGGGGGGRSS